MCSSPSMNLPAHGTTSPTPSLTSQHDNENKKSTLHYTRYGGAPKVREGLHGQRKLDEEMDASFEGTCKLWKVKEVIRFPNLY